MTDGKSEIKKADWVAKIVSDPNNPPNVVMITGVFGDSPIDGHVRIYLNFDLSEYVDAPESAVRHVEPIPGDQAPPGASYIWLDRDVEVIHEPIVKPEPRKAKFLQGRIEQTYARRATVQPPLRELNVPQLEPVFTQVVCESRVIGCVPSQFTICPSVIDNCPSRYVSCESQLTACASAYVGCGPSRFTVCPSVIDNCPSRYVSCESQLTACASAYVGCGPSRFTICPSVIDNCPSALIECVSQYAACYTQDAWCIRTAGAGCVTFDGCPSAVDACPSAPGGCEWEPWGERARRIGGRGFMRRR